jgi:hypothetical protein
MKQQSSSPIREAGWFPDSTGGSREAKRLMSGLAPNVWQKGPAAVRSFSPHTYLGKYAVLVLPFYLDQSQMSTTLVRHLHVLSV